jgi:hypothetical protein
MPKFTLISYKIQKRLAPFFTRRLIGFYLGVAISYFCAYFFAGRETYQPGILPSLIFDFETFRMHLHHWLVSLLFLIFLVLPLFIKQKINTPLFLFVFGFSLGLTAQGILSYSDWDCVFTRKEI